MSNWTWSSVQVDFLRLSLSRVRLDFDIMGDSPHQIGEEVPDFVMTNYGISSFWTMQGVGEDQWQTACTFMNMGYFWTPSPIGDIVHHERRKSPLLSHNPCISSGNTFNQSDAPFPVTRFNVCFSSLSRFWISDLISPASRADLTIVYVFLHLVL